MRKNVFFCLWQDEEQDGRGVNIKERQRKEEGRVGLGRKRDDK